MGGGPLDMMLEASYPIDNNSNVLSAQYLASPIKSQNGGDETSFTYRNSNATNTDLPRTPTALKHMQASPNGKE